MQPTHSSWGKWFLPNKGPETETMSPEPSLPPAEVNFSMFNPRQKVRVELPPTLSQDLLLSSPNPQRSNMFHARKGALVLVLPAFLPPL